MLFVLLLFFPGIVYTQKPNVCKRIIDYFTMDPKNCWYNPDVFLDADDLIESHGYPYERHEVETEDGYLLTMYRLPRYDGHAVYLQHPATTTCTGWIDKGNESLAFMLWEAGYDVWMGNFRGNFYSRKHKTLDPAEAEFWEFSFHELGYYDIANQIDYIVNQTNAPPRNISYVGYSMSGTAALIYGSERPEHAKKWLNLMILMAPSSFLKNTWDIILRLGPSKNELIALGKNLGLHEIIPHNQFFRDIQSICRSGVVIMLCLIIDLLTYGNTPKEISAKWYPIMHSQAPGGMSIKPYIHYLQIVASNKFHKFDFGAEENLRRYNTTEPPEYNLSKIEVPIYMMYGEDDNLVHPKDVEYLYSILQDKTKIYGKKKIKNFAHQSFLYGLHAVDWIYKPIIKLINHVYSKN